MPETEIEEMPEGNLCSEEKAEFLPYELGYLTESMKKVAELELSETENRRCEALQQLRKRIEDEKDLYVRTDDTFLLQFLRVRKYDVEKAFKNIQTYYRFRKKHSHIYNNESNEVVHQVFRKNFIGFLPYRDKSGAVIIVCKAGMWDPEEVSRDLLLWTITHCVIHSIEDPATQVMGYIALVDIRGIGYKHFKQCTIENIILVFNSVQSVLPSRIKGIHFIGMPKIFSTVWNVIYPFLLTSKIKKRVYVHGDNVTSLHKFIPPEILPAEYGGELGPFDNSAWHAKILTKNEWCLNQRHYGYK